jgi:hypothetical protein
LKLSWTVSGAATDVRLDPGIGSVSVDGSRNVSPERSTTYELLARGPGGETHQTVSVTVSGGETAAPPPIRSRGSIEGTVRDPSGAPVAGARVTVTGNGGAATLTTDANGQFALRDIPAGVYDVEITIPGFRRMRRENVVVTAGQPAALNAALEVSESPESVVVSSSRLERPAAGERLVIRDGEIRASRPGSSGLAAAYNRLQVGAFRFELPELQSQQKAVVRLLVDADPIRVTTDDEWEKALSHSGNLAGQPTRIADVMTATLSAGDGVTIRALNQSADGRESVFAGRLTKWNWELSPSASGTQTISVDLRAKVGTEYEPVDPFPIVQQRTVAPAVVSPATGTVQPTGAPASGKTARAFSWLWILGLLLAIAAIAAGFWWKRGRPAAAAIATPDPTAPRLLVIHGMDERPQAERFCGRLGVSRCEYHYGLSGYPVGSSQWQQEFLRGLAEADGVLVLLTGTALGEEWVNWQVEQTIRQQAARGTPIYPVILDEKVSRAAATLGRLSSFAWWNGTRGHDLDELKERVAAIQPAPTRLVKCFISYSRKLQPEIDMAVRLEADLEQLGYQCFRDLTDLPPGEEWEREIRRQLAAATHLLVLVTPSSVASRWVLKEILWAEGKKIIPLLSEGVTLPEELARYQGIAFSSYETGLAELRRALQAYHPARKTGAA